MIMMIPTQISAAGFIKLVDTFGMTDTYWPLILPRSPLPPYSSI